MTGFYLYLLKAILSLGLVYGIYILCLRKLTFFQWNRWYLLLYSFISFIVPFIDISDLAAIQQNPSPASLLEQVPGISHWVSPDVYLFQQISPLQHTLSTGSNGNVIITSMILVSILLLIRFGISIFSLHKIIKGAELFGYVGHCKIIRVLKPLSPFSFTNTIVIGNQNYSSDELEKILTHEMIHTRQRHSIDLFFAEILIVLAWWNPFSWLIRKSIRQNLEFIADREVIKQGADIKPYQMLLLKTMQNPALSITNAFSVSHLKKRIKMMNVKPSQRLELARFLLIAPAFVLLTLLFRSPTINAQLPDSMQKRILPLSNDLETLIPASKNNQEGYSEKSDTLYFGGVVIHVETGKPVPKFPISISLNDEILTTLLTDQNGRYFYGVPIPQTGLISSFSWKLLNKEFAAGEAGISIIDSAAQPELYVNLVSPKKSGRSSVSEPVQISLEQIKEWKNNSITILKSIEKKSRTVFDQHKVMLAMEKDFLNKVDTANKTFVLFNGWLYWKRMENLPWRILEKPENLILKLAEDTVTYEEVNNWFASHNRFPVLETQANKNKGSKKSIEFYTEAFSLPKPSNALLANGTYQAISLNNWQEEYSKDDAIFLNGFRTYSKGQLMNYNLLTDTDNGKVKKIYRFTGALAAHYSEKALVVWWIETKDSSSVFNRPEFSDKRIVETKINRQKSNGRTTLTANNLHGTFVKGENVHTLQADDGIVIKTPELSEEYLLAKQKWYPISSIISDSKGVHLPDGKTMKITKLKVYNPKDGEKKFGSKGKFGVLEVIEGNLINN